MQILLDHNVPLPLRRVLRERLVDDTVDTTAFHGWQALTNGELLRTAEASGFDLFISADQNLFYQQHLESRQIGVLILRTNHWNKIKSNLDEIVTTIGGMARGDFVEMQFARRAASPRPSAGKPTP